MESYLFQANIYLSISLIMYIFSMAPGLGATKERQKIQAYPGKFKQKQGKGR